MNQKRIAMISYHTCPLASEEGKETGGMNVYVLETAKALTKQGYFVDIFTRSQDTGQPHIVHIAENLRLMHIKAGPETYILPNTEENKMNFLSYIPEFVDNIKAFQEKDNVAYDVIDAHYYLSGLAGLALKKANNNSSLLMTFHTLALMKNLTSRNGLSKAEEKRIEIETQLVQEANLVITPSDNEKKYVEYLYYGDASKIQVISPGVDTTLFRPLDKAESKQAVGVSPEHKMILFVGRIDPVKGLDVLLYAMRILFAKNPKLKACLWIVGGDVSQSQNQWSQELQKLDQLRELLGLDTTVKFIGQQHQHDLPKYYNAADLVVMPSHYESFGMTALEAMACGTPVLTTNVTGVSELLDETCQKHITTANNPLLMADAMKDILCHHHEKEDEEIFETVKHYDWKYVAEKIAKLY